MADISHFLLRFPFEPDCSLETGVEVRILGPLAQGSIWALKLCEVFVRLPEICAAWSVGW